DATRGGFDAIHGLHSRDARWHRRDAWWHRCNPWFAFTRRAVASTRRVVASMKSMVCIDATHAGFDAIHGLHPRHARRLRRDAWWHRCNPWFALMRRAVPSMRRCDTFLKKPLRFVIAALTGVRLGGDDVRRARAAEDPGRASR